MIAVWDILLNDKFEVLYEDGDFKIGESDQQHIQHILLARPGQFAQHPLIGCGVQDYDHSSQSVQEKKQNISLQLESDNYKINSLVITTDAFGNEVYQIDAIRIK